MPNNAVLVVAGDFKTEEAKQWIQNTLVVSKGPTVERQTFVEEPITEIRATYEILTFRSRWL
jgi:predicted Zn-dependent peptidase